MKNKNLEENVGVLRSLLIQTAWSIKHKRREDRMLCKKYPLQKFNEVTPERIEKENVELKILKKIVLSFPQVDGLVNTNHWWKFYGDGVEVRMKTSETRDFTLKELETLVQCFDDNKDYIDSKYPNMIGYMDGIRKETSQFSCKDLNL